MSVKFGVVAVAFSADPREAVARARQMGFAGVQFEDRSSQLSFSELSQSGRREFRHLLSSQDQQLVALRVDLGGKGLGPGTDVDRAIARIDRAMEAAAGMGAPLVCVDLGPLPEPARPAPSRPKVDPAAAGLIIVPTAPEMQAVAPSEPEVKPDPTFESSVDGALSELGRRADRYSAVVALRCDLASFAALDRTLRAAGCPWFGVDLDPVAILKDRWGVEEVFSRLGPLIRHVRARDAIAGHDKRTKPATIGRGGTNWGHFVSLLDEAGYSGWLTVDPIDLPDRTTAARDAIAHLKTIRT